jgi:competence protein ComEA
MNTLLAKRIPVAWFLLGMIVLAAAGIVWLIIARGATPGNAVLIYSAAPSEATGETVSQQAGTQSAEVVPTIAPTPPILSVYVSGEVLEPGVYTLPAGARIGDAVAASGGFTSRANPGGINLAARLQDEQHITVPRVGETVEAEAANGPSTGGASESASNGESTPGHPFASPVTSVRKVNINTASASELEALPGIGEVLSRRIVADREAHGPFKTVDDLMRVPGIKQGLMSGLRDLVTVGP